MTYPEAKQIKSDLEQKHRETSSVLKRFPTGQMGLIPDHIKASAEYQAARREYNLHFRRLQDFNTMFCKTFEREYAEERKLRGRL